MSSDDRLDRLEHRLTALETIVRQLVERTRSADAAVPPGPPRPVAPVRPRPATPPPPHKSPITIPGGAGIEEWIGRRGLLAVGVLAVLLAAGYLLKLSFERGWISEPVRCLGGAGAGVAVGLLGWRLLGRSKSYGASLIGLGGGIVYLSVWAAARLYGLMPPVPAIIGLAAVSAAVGVLAYALDVEGLGAAAELGAFMAPVVLGQRQPQANLLLIYTAAAAIALGLAAALRRWRFGLLLAVVGGLILDGVAVRAGAVPFGAVALAAIVAAGAVLVGTERNWWELRLAGFVGGWVLLALAANRGASGVVLLGAAVVLAAPIWWHALRRPDILVGDGPPTARAAPDPLDLLYFAAVPFLLVWAARPLAPGAFGRDRGLLASLVAIPYFAVGYLRPRPAFAAVAVAALGVAAWAEWPGLGAPIALALLALSTAAMDHLLDRHDGQLYSVVAVVVAYFHLATVDLLRRPAVDPAFVGPWILVLWLLAAVTGVLAAGLWRGGPHSSGDRTARVFLWSLAGAAVFLGVTGELQRFFREGAGGSAGGTLAGSLAVSLWWLLFASGLVLLGFQRDRRPVRLAGLGVAGLALIKIALSDLASLDALYRVACVLALGLVSLSLAYLYHRQDRRRAG